MDCVNRRGLGLSLLVFFVCAALAGSPVSLAAGSGPAAVLGSWDVMAREMGGMSFEITMNIEKERVTMTSRCSHRDNTVIATVSSPAEITESQIRVLEARTQEKEHSPGYLNCKASIKPMAVSYEMKDGNLVFHDPSNGKTMMFTRSGSAG